MTFIMQNTPTSIQKINENGMKTIQKNNLIIFNSDFRFKKFFEKC